MPVGWTLAAVAGEGAVAGSRSARSRRPSRRARRQRSAPRSAEPRGEGEHDRGCLGARYASSRRLRGELTGSRGVTARRYGPCGPIRPSGSMSIRIGSPVCRDLSRGSSAWAAVYRSRPATPASAKPRKPPQIAPDRLRGALPAQRPSAREHVAQHALAGRDAGLGELADDLRGGAPPARCPPGGCTGPLARSSPRLEALPGHGLGRAPDAPASRAALWPRPRLGRRRRFAGACAGLRGLAGRAAGFGGLARLRGGAGAAAPPRGGAFARCGRVRARGGPARGSLAAAGCCGQVRRSTPASCRRARPARRAAVALAWLAHRHIIA